MGIGGEIAACRASDLRSSGAKGIARPRRPPGPPPATFAPSHPNYPRVSPEKTWFTPLRNGISQGSKPVFHSLNA